MCTTIASDEGAAGEAAQDISTVADSHAVQLEYGLASHLDGVPCASAHDSTTQELDRAVGAWKAFASATASKVGEAGQEFADADETIASAFGIE